MPTEMMDILRLTKTGNLIEATAAIQRALRGGSGQTNHPSHSVALDATQTSAGLWTTVPQAGMQRPQKTFLSL